jgi:ankyrin repeat protein
MVAKAIAEGSDIDVSNENGWTGAMFAVSQVSNKYFSFHVSVCHDYALYF